MMAFHMCLNQISCHIGASHDLLVCDGQLTSFCASYTTCLPIYYTILILIGLVSGSYLTVWGGFKDRAHRRKTIFILSYMTACLNRSIEITDMQSMQCCLLLAYICERSHTTSSLLPTPSTGHMRWLYFSFACGETFVPPNLTGHMSYANAHIRRRAFCLHI